MSWDWSDRDRVALGRFLERRGIGAGPVTTRRIGDGHSNLTFLVTGPDTRVVVRRPPPGPLPAGAYDVLREARILAGVHGRGVPVPDILATAETGELLDSPLYVMSYVDGPIVTTRTPDPVDTPHDRRAVAESFVDTLAALHTIDPTSAGLPDRGPAHGSLGRQLRIRRLLGDEPVPSGIDEIAAWLERDIPTASADALVHHDYRLGNVVLAPDPPGRIAAVLDWELAARGDPLLDIGYLLATWPAAGRPPNAVAAMGTAALEPGYPTTDELIDRYRHTTRRPAPDLRWYQVLALWKLAVLFTYNRCRTRTGHGDAYYADPALADSFLDDARELTRA